MQGMGGKYTDTETDTRTLRLIDLIDQEAGWANKLVTLIAIRRAG